MQQGGCVNNKTLSSCADLGLLVPTGQFEETRWHNVGELSGDYEMVPTYVGEGRGTHAKETIQRVSGYRPQPIFLCGFGMCACLIMMLIAWFCFAFQPPPAPTTTTTSTFTQFFDCEYGFEDWQDLWGFDQQDWCCLHIGRACPTVPFDCDVGWETMGAYWQPDKKAWCCQHYNRGCPETTTITTTTPFRRIRTLPLTTTTTPIPTSWVMVPVPVPFNCALNADTWMTSWEVDQQIYCCEHAQVGCIEAPTDEKPFDCAAGTQWMDKWAVEKREWCCNNEQVGCMADVVLPNVDTSGLLRGSTGNSAEFDCSADAERWETSWSEEKRDFCCTTVGLGCRGSAA